MDDKLRADFDPYLDLLKKCLTASIYEESFWYVLGSDDLAMSKPFSRGKYMPDFLKRFIVSVLGQRDYLLIKKEPFDFNVRERGEDWPCFGYTMIGHKRLDNIQACIDDILANDVPGDLIETGAWRGGATIFMRAMLKSRGVTDRKVWVADSFEGLPSPDKEKYPDEGRKDYSKIGVLKVSLEQVQRNFAKFDLLDGQVIFLKGWFRDTLPTAPIDRLALLRLDGDMYESTWDALTALYPKVSPNGYVIIDDYYNWPMCRKAVTAYRKEHGIEAELIKIDEESVYWKVSAS